MVIAQYRQASTAQWVTRIAIGLTVVVGAAAIAWTQPGQAQAATTCTWAGTPADPTGTFTLEPGITNTPSVGPLAFNATGDLAGGAGCSGKLTYDGVFDAGASCLAATFHVKVKGLPGVVRAVGSADNLVPAPALLYDAKGNVVGTEVAQIVTETNVPHYTDCSTPNGFTGGWPGMFSSVVELFADSK
jgi:hypothetical protein